MPAAAPLYTCKPNGEVPPRILESSLPGTYGAEEPVTLYQHFKAAVDEWGPNNALAHKRLGKGQKAQDVQWEYYTWNEYYRAVLDFGKACLALKIPVHGCVNILGFNSPEWFIAHMGIISIGGISAGIYITNQPDACKYVSEHSDAQVIVVENESQLKKYKTISSQLPHLKAIVTYAEPPPADFRVDNPNVTIYHWPDFLKLGVGISDAAVIERAHNIKPGQCATLIYTSGTTGPPKAVMLSHDNVTWTARSIEYYFPDRRPTDTLISYLPLSHIAAQCVDVLVMMRCGGCVYFAQPDALKGSIIHTMKDVRPNIFFGVPRIWEKMYEAMQGVRAKTPLPLRLVSDWAKARGLAHSLSTQYGEDLEEPFGYGLASKLLNKVKRELGLDQTRYCATGAAPIAKEVVQYFASLGIIIYELFGQSESTGICTANGTHAWKLGTVGRPLPGTEVRLNADDGEFQFRGRNVFMGYMKMEKETAEAMREGGWLRSGDVATIDFDHDPNTAKPSGFCRITGRIKELIITAGGENIPPVLIENELKAAMGALASCMVVGDRRKFLTVLLTLHVDEEGQLMGPSLKQAQDMGGATAIKDVENDPQWKKYLNDGIKVANSKTTSRAQVVQKWAMLPQDFSEANGELTPTLKLKRKVACERHSAVIEKLYAE